ncbi:MAG: hypothetical protein E7395_00480 [Ruminococcaceae bacterium]|nr:hypothetical protein [Oscillospiraceae bacterium]
MKMYTKPTVDVVELSVKETMADLPAAVQGSYTGSLGGTTVTNYTTTVYDLTATNTSAKANG